MQNAGVVEFENYVPGVPAGGSSGERYRPIVPLLETTLTQTSAQGAYLYRFDGETAGELILAAGLPAAARSLPLEIPESALREHAARTSPIALQGDAWQDRRFAPLPEFQRNRFEGVTSVPVVQTGVVVGMLNVGRTRRVPLKPAELGFLLSVSVPIAALLAAENENQNLRKEVDKLTRQLADRKLIERAKGLLQTRFEWSEEEAYLYVRRLSRQRRIPMRDVALEVIGNGGFHLDRAAVGSGD
jgi:GAF domain-containing protein